MAEFFRQIRVADDFKEAGLRRLRQPLEISRPDFERRRGAFHSDSFGGLSMAHESET